MSTTYYSLPEDHILSYANAFLRTDSESVETTARRGMLSFAGFVARMGEELLPRRVMFRENLDRCWGVKATPGDRSGTG